MSRCYEFTFIRRGDGDIKTVMGFGNTRRTAEASARWKLIDVVTYKNALTYYAHRVTVVPAGDPRRG